MIRRERQLKKNRSNTFEYTRMKTKERQRIQILWQDDPILFSSIFLITHSMLNQSVTDMPLKWLGVQQLPGMNGSPRFLSVHRFNSLTFVSLSQNMEQSQWKGFSLRFRVSSCRWSKRRHLSMVLIRL